jgi:hypothetical protein
MPKPFKHSWVLNLKNVAPQKHNAICKTRAQYAKRNFALKYLKCIALQQLMLRMQVFTQKIKGKECNQNLLNKNMLVW